MTRVRPYTFNTGSTIAGTTQIGDLSVGGEQSGFNGNISTIKIYNNILSPENVLKNYNEQKFRFGH